VSIRVPLAPGCGRGVQCVDVMTGSNDLKIVRTSHVTDEHHMTTQLHHAVSAQQHQGYLSTLGAAVLYTGIQQRTQAHMTGVGGDGCVRVF